MKKGWLLIGGAVAAVIYAASRSKAIQETVKYLQYDITGVKFKVSNILKPEVLLTFNIFNPNKTSVPVQDIIGQIKASGTTIASFSNVSPITINGEQNTSVQVSARISALSLVLKIIRGESLGVLTVDALLKTGSYSIPVVKTLALKDMIGAAPVKRKGLTMKEYFKGRKTKRVKPAGGFLSYWGKKNRFKSMPLSTSLT